MTIHTAARRIPRGEVLAPGRGLVYDLLGRAAPELGQALHTDGWGRFGMVPFGYSGPAFPAAGRPGPAGLPSTGPGILEIGSPLPAVAEGIRAGLDRLPVIAWGATAFHVTGVEEVPAPDFADGVALLRTVTPAVMKGGGFNATKNRAARATPGEPRQGWLLPGEVSWDAYTAQNLVRKARTLDLPEGVRLEAVTWVGPRASFVTGGGGNRGGKPGAHVEVRVAGDPVTLRALWAWGIGQANSSGFGWVRAVEEARG
ncbi:hypothetical protein ACFVX9_16585 [Kitasatospora sp. NPDC058243]|uniref:hypothetical protein n=1 Tax=Kitasatospora sp. NPDC058243 TaxID=3346397 RepID=UPI0036DC5584